MYDSKEKTYTGDVGTIVEIDCGVEVPTDATLLQIKYKKPDQTTGNWTAQIYNKNYLRYTTITEDLDQNGVYKVQAYVESPSWSGRGKTASFTVYREFE